MHTPIVLAIFPPDACESVLSIVPILTGKLPSIHSIDQCSTFPLFFPFPISNVLCNCTLVYRIILESKSREEEDGTAIMVSHLNLVDLAGSERAGQTGAKGSRLKEGCNINKSLMMLGQVIQKLSSGHGSHINYRDSKLTRLLQNSLGGNARSTIIATVTPAGMSEEQSFSTLRFASQVTSCFTFPLVGRVKSGR